MAYEIYFCEEKERLPVEITDQSGTFLHFYHDTSQLPWTELNSKQCVNLAANISNLLEHEKLTTYINYEELYEKFNLFSSLIDDFHEENKEMNKKISKMKGDRLGFFQLLLISEKYNLVDCSDTFFHRLKKFDWGELKQDFDIISVIKELFYLDVELNAEFKVVFHDILEFSLHFIKVLQILEAVGIDVIFCIYPDSIFNVSELKGILIPSVRESLEIHEKEKEKFVSIFTKNDDFWSKDSWLLTFIYPLLRMWNEEIGDIKICKEELKICCHGWWFPNESGRKMWKIYSKIAELQEEELDYGHFLDQIEAIYHNRSTLQIEEKNVLFQRFAIYEELTADEYQFFITGIHKLHELAGLLFINLNNFQEIRSNFQHLDFYYRKKHEIFIGLEERKILECFDSYINALMPENTPPSPVFTMLREKIKFSIQENEVYLTKKLAKGHFFSAADFDIEEELFDLFDSKYIKLYKIYLLKEQEKQQEEFFSLAENMFVLNKNQSYIKKIMQISYHRVPTMSFFLCPFRYVSTFLLQGKTIIHDRALYIKSYENILVSMVWQEIAGTNDPGIVACLLKFDELYHRFFPFFTWKERFDAIIGAKNYLSHSIAKSSVKVRDYAPSHMDMKFNFGEAFFHDVGKPLPPPAFMNFVRKKYHSLHQIPKKEDKLSITPLRQEMTDYINKNTNIYRQGIWCDFCTERKNCIKADGLY